MREKPELLIPASSLEVLKIAVQAAALEGLSIAEQAAAQKQLLLETVSLRLERQEALLRQNAALQLAHTLEPGKPCPVCGALEHPSPAAGQETLLEPRQLESLRQEEKSARQAQVKAAALAASRKAEADQAAEAVSQQEAAWKEAAASAGDFTREETAAQLAQAAALAEKAKGEAARLEAAKEKLRALEKERDACQQRETSLREKLSALEACGRLPPVRCMAVSMTAISCFPDLPSLRSPTGRICR